jgi:hypothetical protein
MSKSEPTGYPIGRTYDDHPIGCAEFAAQADSSEFGLPEGIDVPGYENKPPSEGGRYKGKTPECPRRPGA